MHATTRREPHATILRGTWPLAAGALLIAAWLGPPGGPGDGAEEGAASATSSEIVTGNGGLDGGAADSVKAVVGTFHRALSVGDSSRALELLHSELRVFESGHAETLAEYRSGHLGADMSFSAGVEREVLSELVFGDGDWATYLSESRATGVFRDREVDSRGTETMVLVRTPDGWRIRHIHWSSR